MNTEKKLNLSMLFDFYEMTMGNGYFQAGYKDRITYFDVLFRDVPDKGGFAVCAGLDQLIDYIQDLHFDEEDIAYLKTKPNFSRLFRNCAQVEKMCTVYPSITYPSHVSMMTGCRPGKNGIYVNSKILTNSD